MTFSDTFLSRQVGASPVNGDILTTDGTDSSWATPSSLGIHDPVSVTDSAEIDFTLTGQDITADLKTGSIDVLKLDAGVQTSLGLADTASQPGHTHLEADITDLQSYLLATDIGTLAELNAIITDATLIDTTDSRLSDARTPLSHTHPIATDISGLGTGVAASLAIANNSAGGYSPINGTATLTNKTIAFGSNTLTNVMSLTTAQSVTAGIKKTFQANATNAGLRLAGVTASPSTLVAGDIWYRSDTSLLSYRGASSVRTMFVDNLGKAGGQTLIGGTAASETLTIQSTSHATKGKITIGGTITVDGANLRQGINVASPGYSLDIQPGTSSDGQFQLTGTTENTFAMNISPTVTGTGNFQMMRQVPVLTPTGSGQTIYNLNTNTFLDGSASITSLNVFFARAQLAASSSVSLTNLYVFRSAGAFDSSSGASSITTTSQFYAGNETFATNNRAFVSAQASGSGNHGLYFSGTADNYLNGNLGIKTSSPVSDLSISSGNIALGNATPGTSAVNVLAISNGTVPSSSPADMVQLFSVDLSAGNATLGLRTETSVVTETVTSDRTLSVRINGTTYKILLKA